MTYRRVVVRIKVSEHWAKYIFVDQLARTNRYTCGETKTTMGKKNLPVGIQQMLHGISEPIIIGMVSGFRIVAFRNSHFRMIAA